MRLMVIGQLPPPIHGSTVMTRTLIETLKVLGHTVSLVDRRFSTSVAEVGLFSFRKLGSAAWMPFRLLYRVLRVRPTAVIFFATNSTYSLISDWLLSEILRLFDTRVILYLHTVGYERIAGRGPRWTWLVKRLLKSGHTVVILGPTLARDVTRWVRQERIAIVPNMAADPIDIPDSPDVNKPPMVLYFSNLVPAKGADVFVDTALQLIRKQSTGHFVLAGASTNDEFTDSLKSRVAAAGADSRFTFAGPVADVRRKWQLLHEASVLAFPSAYPFEAQPLTILEALAVGTPVVAFDIGGIRDVIRDGIDGILVDAGNRTAFERALSLFLSSQHSPEFSETQIRSGYSQRFSRSAFERKWESVLNPQRSNA